MNVTPVRTYRIPSYPDGKQVESNPEILRRLPKRWQTNMLLTAFLSGTLILSATSCRKDTTQTADSSGYKIAPIFVHGDGIRLYHSITVDSISNERIIKWDTPFVIKPQSSSGTGSGPIVSLLGSAKQKPRAFLVGNGPSWPGGFDTEARLKVGFINEADAFNIIVDEALKAGLQFDPYFDISNGPGDESKHNDEEGSNLEIFRADGYQKDKNVGFEFVSVTDASQMDDGKVTESVEDDVNTGRGVKVEVLEEKTYNLLETAEKLRREKEEQGTDFNMGIFYDPGQGYYEGDTLVTSEEALRRQVRDFVEWLKTQGL